MQQQAQSCAWLELPHLRQMCQAGLNKSEQRHALTQAGCTFKQGRIADHGLEPSSAAPPIVTRRIWALIPIAVEIRAVMRVHAAFCVSMARY